MSNQRPHRNNVLRHYAGGTSRALREIRQMRRIARRRMMSEKFAEWLNKLIQNMKRPAALGDSPENHIHPRHLRRKERP